MKNIFDYIRKFSHENSNSNVIVDKTRRITYKELFNCIKNNSTKLKKCGYGKKQKVIIKIEKQIDFIIVFLSLLSIDCWVIPVPYDIKNSELKQIVDLSNGQLFLMDEFDIFDTTNIIENVNTFDSINTGILHLTSGSTGIAKLCKRSVEALTNEGISYMNTFSISSNDRLLSIPPLYHSFSLGVTIMASLVSGACIYTNDDFIPRGVLKKIQKDKISILILVPIFARILGEVCIDREYDFSSLRVPLVGAGSISKNVFFSFKERFKVSLMSNYGSTETGGIVSRLYSDEFKSIGKPMNGVEIKLCNEFGKKVKDGEMGEIRVKCSSMLSNYYKSEMNIFDEEGFFLTGDIAILSNSGNLYLKGRKKLFINIGGNKVNPVEVEEIILKMKKIEECVVVGCLNSRLEEFVMAYVVVNVKIEEYEIRNFCQKYLSNYKIPSKFIFREYLPKNNLGKIIRSKLKR